MTSRGEEAWHSPLFWKKVVSRVSIVGFEAFLEGGSLFSCSIFFIFCGGGNAWCRAQSFIEQKASGDCLCWSRAVFYRAKASVIIKLGLRCSLWFALDEWNLKVIFEVSAFLLEECLSYLGLCTFSHSPWRHICDVIPSFVPYCQSNCKLSSLVANSCEWNIVIGWKLLLWMFSLKLDTTSPRCLF